MNDVDDDNLIPSTDQTSLNARQEPGVTGTSMSVPQDLADEGHDTNEPQPDSPESLDQEITDGANREDIDPDHSYDRPAVDTIDEEENGVK